MVFRLGDECAPGLAKNNIANVVRVLMQIESAAKRQITALSNLVTEGFTFQFWMRSILMSAVPVL